MHSAERRYLPAAGKDWLLPFYDPLTRLLGVGAVHRKLILQAAIEPGHRVLEIGCGTGNLTMLVDRLSSAAQVVGMDPDEKALERARHKAGRSGATISFDQGFGEALPYPDASFDRVLSALMLHHLQPETKRAAIQEVLRVLRPGGSLHVVDFAEHPHEPGGVHGFLGRLFGNTEQPTSACDIVDLMRDVGFQDCRELGHERNIAGQIVYCSAVRHR